VANTLVYCVSILILVVVKFYWICPICNKVFAASKRFKEKHIKARITFDGSMTFEPMAFGLTTFDLNNTQTYEIVY
jgi:hypothetical protein